MVQTRPAAEEELVTGTGKGRSGDSALAPKVTNKAYVFPLILYRLSVLPLCRNRKKALERLISSFLGDSGKHQIFRKRLCHGARNVTWLTFLCRALTEDLIFKGS